MYVCMAYVGQLMTDVAGASLRSESLIQLSITLSWRQPLSSGSLSCIFFFLQPFIQLTVHKAYAVDKSKMRPLFHPSF